MPSYTGYIRSELRTRARLRADQDDSTEPADADYNLWINEAMSEVWWEMTMAGWPQAAITATGSTTAGVSVIPLTANSPFGMLLSVMMSQGGVWYELRRLDESQRAAMMSQPQGWPTHYEFTIDNISGGTPTLTFYPTPSGAIPYSVRYTVTPNAMSTDSSVWYGPTRTDELIVLKTAMKAMRKEGNDQGAAMVEREYQMLLAKIIDAMGRMDARNATVIRDVGPLAPKRDPFDYDV